MLPANKAVHGRSGRSVVRRVPMSWIDGTFLGIWDGRGDGFQVAKDRGSLETHRWRCGLLRTPSVSFPNRAFFCGVVERLMFFDGMCPGDLNRWLDPRHLLIEKPPP